MCAFDLEAINYKPSYDQKLYNNSFTIEFVQRKHREEKIKSPAHSAKYNNVCRVVERQPK